jgi:mevalonate kinase
VEKYYSNGKLLITGEYVVLDGALSLAIPTQFGQSLIVEPIDQAQLLWKSIDEKGNCWFETEIKSSDIDNLDVDNSNDIAKRLLDILKVAKKLNPSFLEKTQGFKITTKLDFKKDWGLGTSSTLISNIAQWAKIDPYTLLKMTFGGSGYDIACAQHDNPITYQIKHNQPIVNEVSFNPTFHEHLYFIYLNKKQNSREGIAQYRLNPTNKNIPINEINAITKDMISCNSLSEFESLLTNHELIVSQLINQDPIKERYFNDFNGSIKSLGAWGGDFILATSQSNPESYFKNRGFETIIPFQEMILKN